MQTIVTIGFDIAKSVFQVHGVDAAGDVVIRRQVEASPGPGVFSEAATVPGWHRSLCLVSPLVAGTSGTWPYRTADAASLREALRCAPTARITSGGRIHPESCRLIW